MSDRLEFFMDILSNEPYKINSLDHRIEIRAKPRAAIPPRSQQDSNPRECNKKKCELAGVKNFDVQVKSTIYI